MPREAVSPVFLYGFFFVLVLCHADPGPGCSKTHPVVGFGSEFKMVQHQLRGSFVVVDDCSFRVSDFDMISGSEVVWWGAMGTDFDKLMAGFVISDQSLNQTQRNSSFVVRLRDNVTWSEIRVLAVWDRPTASNFGRVVLENRTEESVSSSAPSPSPASDTEEAGRVPHTEPTMFDNCKALSESFRVRWTVNSDQNSIDLGLEASTGSMNYMAFGWANPKSNSDLMLGADVAVTGFADDGVPFVDDFYITEYSDCAVNKDGSAHGVCPDTIYEGTDPIGLVNNTKLIYGHRRDGVSFVRYQRPLRSPDQKYDLPVDPAEVMTVIWAVGKVRPPDTLRPYYLPQNHGGPQRVAFGHLALNLSAASDDCLGPLESDAAGGPDQDLITADPNTPLVVTAGPALRYPNPPNPARVLYVNKRESPVLRVERGVPVRFSIQAGHDVALYLTSDPVGGNATRRNATEVVYSGGPGFEGVPASPRELVWSPDRNTPNEVYYQSVFQEKMGWKVQVVDGGLADMYSKNVLLDDQQVTFFWTLSEDGSISIAARAERKSGYLAVGLGSGRMVGSFAYVGWVDNIGRGRVATYWIDGKEAAAVHPTNETLSHVRCKSENGIITLEFTRALNPGCASDRGRPLCRNIVDKTTPLKVVWAMGAGWADGAPAMHSAMSSRAVRVLLTRGSAEAEQDLRPVLAVHGFMMFLAWGILLPGGIVAARYLKRVKGDGWYKVHVYLQYSGLAIIMLAVLFAVAELRAFNFGSLHVKLGVLATLLACAQPVNASFRPKRAEGEGGSSSPRRRAWEWLHKAVGRGAVVAGVAALFTGMRHLGDRYGGENVRGLTLALIVWLLIGALLVFYLEYRERARRREKAPGRGNWVLGNQDEEDDSLDLLTPNGTRSEKDSQTSRRMEIQLEPINK